jgi:transposase
LGNKELAEVVLEAVRMLDDGELNPPLSPATAPAFRPRVMLAMLTYCYAIGVYSSKDVEEMMYVDAPFRALCGMEYPDWKRLKRFRRDNHPALERTLEETFSRIWILHETPSQTRADEPSNGHSSNGLREPARQGWFLIEAQSRIEQAMFIDHMTDV